MITRSSSQGNADLISATDVSKIIEPVLRPNKISSARPIKTVVLDPGHGGAARHQNTGVLVEAGFLNDSVEGARIATPQYQEQLGEAIAQAVATYNRAINFQNAGPMIASATTNHPPHTHTITESSGTRPAVSAKPAPARSPAAQTPN